MVKRAIVSITMLLLIMATGIYNRTVFGYYAGTVVFNIDPETELPSNGTYVDDYEFFVEDLIYAGQDFGNNTSGSCVAVAGGIVLEYYDHSLADFIVPDAIPTLWNTECDNSGNLPIYGTSSVYDLSIPTGSSVNEGLHRYLLSISGAPYLPLSNWDLYWAYYNYDDTATCFTNHVIMYNAWELTQTEMSNIIKNYIDINVPVVSFTNFNHAVVIFGYDEANFYFHTGWDSPENGEPYLGCMTVDEVTVLITMTVSIHHTLETLISRNSYSHTYECVCGEIVTEPRQWVRKGTSYTCSVCGARTSNPPLTS